MLDNINWAHWLTSGTPPQWALLVIVIIAVLRYGPIWHKQVIDAQADKRLRYSVRIGELEDKLRKLRSDCDQETANLKKEIKGLHDEINGLRAQRITEQMAIIRGILQTVDSPELKRQLSMLEAVQIAIGSSHQVLPPSDELGESDAEGS